MNGTILDVLRTIAASSGLAAFFAFLGYCAQSLVKRRQNEIGGEAGLRHDMMGQLAALRIEMREREKDCDIKIDDLNRRIVAVAQSTMELSSVVERHDPASPALERARVVLQKAFQPSFSDDPAMMKLLRELDKRGGMK